MLTKPSDIQYCGVNQDKIKSAKPTLNEDIVRYHHLYLTERHEIYKKKEIQKIAPPWTEDEVFLNYRFTNIRRELDRESKWLIQNVCEADIPLKDKILNCILFRTFNKSGTSELINMPILNIDSVDLEHYKQIFLTKQKADPDYVFFTPAFMTGGLKKGNAFKNPPYVRRTATVIAPDGSVHMKGEYITCRDFVNEHDGYDIEDWEKNIPTRMVRFVQRESLNGIAEDLINAKDQKEAFNRLTQVTGLGDFLAYQIFVDLTYIPEYKFSENEFVVSGPGCSRGLDMYFKDKDGMTYEECLFWLRDNIQSVWEQYGLRYYPEELFDHLEDYDRNYNVMMLENSFCENFKNVKARTGTGRPRNRYFPTSEKPTKKITKTGTSLADFM
jgi:hypothetical protein